MAKKINNKQPHTEFIPSAAIASVYLELLMLLKALHGLSLKLGNI